jgi:uncharacterized damage-inducible protein DinB
MSTTASQPGISTDFALAFRETLLHGLAEEMKITRKVLAAIPDDKSGYRPEPKARTAADLAWHLASEDVILLEQIVEGSFHFPDTRYDGERPKTHVEMAAWYEKKFAAALDKVRAMSPQKLTAPIDFLGMFQWPAFLYLVLANNHSIHHRGQLSTYLRPMGAKVPSIYGPSADEGMPGM